jgi:NAD(P)-dependent dehydrogenase (short-subunit alcohol dehydrogenase family)
MSQDSRPALFPSYTKKWHTSSTPVIDPTRPELSAKGKVIVITGGGTGIGAQIALSFARAGASAIGLIARREEILQSSKAEIEKVSSSTKVNYAVADILQVADLTFAFEKFHSSFGKIDILVSNAGFLNKPSKISSVDSDDWWKAMEINVRGTFNTIRAFLPLASLQPTLPNITSGVVHLPSKLPGMSAYAASKVGNAKLVKYVGNEVHGLHVVNVQPGVIASEMNTKHSEIPPMDDSQSFYGHSLENLN